MPFSEDLIKVAQNLPDLAEQEAKSLDSRLKDAKNIQKLAATLEQYVKKDNPLTLDLIDVAEKLPNLAKHEIEQLEVRLQDAKALRKLTAAMMLYVQSSKPLHILELQPKNMELLQRLETSQHPNYADIQEIFRVATEDVKPWSARFPKVFSQACQDANLPIDPDSRHPNYTFDHRFFKVTLDERKKTARISNTEAGKLDDVLADIPAVIEKLQEHRKRVFDKAQDSRTFLKLLRSEYLKIINAEHRKDGDSVSIRPIMHTLSHNKGKDCYRPDEFLVALSHLLKEGQTQINGFQLDLQQTRDTSNGVLLITESSRGYVGFLLFKKAHV